ncbi:MAG TPA: MotA/TolQ/ExbB proton channel family protein [Povalibacter sp.]|uniref:MotA/TolQ/ExbB proton channel family protein n=1 Tax=Povalibacter sp. TaxID=1962978 RepID=UPI002D064869|nr:MotA/TolQ/ExbB proton channel family protein [Povalibacter sp.]HMN43686.1 MotA/TolQ/ExbB proton channel family protein [Povalibacter sp.]
MLEVLTAPFAAFHQMRELGGPVVNGIFAACVLMWAIVIERYWYFRRILPGEASRMLGEWLARPNRHSWTSQQVRRAMISRLNTSMSANLQVMRVLVPMCPLLGLLGTVGGMLEVFDSMAARGSADARSMASGISEAMICTLTGLAVSITGLYPVYYFRRRVRVETELLADKFSY